MKKIILTVCVLIFTVCLMVACSDAEVKTQNVTTTVLPNTTDTSVVTTQPATTEPPVTTEPIGEAQDIVLHFTDAYVCSSKFDPKSGGQEGSLVHWDRWHSTDYIDVTDYYGLFY